MVPTVPPAVSPHRRAPRGTVRAYFRNIRLALSTAFDGMSVTMSYMFRRPLTIQYPDKIAKPVQEMLPESYRGVLEVDMDRCTVCLQCQKICPLGCINIESCKNPETGNREVSKFDIDIGLCMYCGLCAETCNFDALDHTREFEATVTTPDQLVLHFVETPREVTKLKAAEMPVRKHKGSILQKMIPVFGRRHPQEVWTPTAYAAAPAPAPKAPAAAPKPAAPVASAAPSAPTSPVVPTAPSADSPTPEQAT
jgi:NADH-quinone oxidoreductase subunit I/NAD(P)H-quinone oxidoreductase subunit I